MAQPKNFGFDEEAVMVRDSARKFLRENAGIESLRTLVAKDHEQAYESDVPPAPYDETVWHKTVELGWPALAVPEAAGGAGMPMAALTGLAEEVGRAALPGPLTSTILATCVLREAGESAHASLERIAGGEAATLAFSNADGSWDAAETSVTAKGNALSGTACFVQDARKADLFVVAARDGKKLGLFVIDAKAPGVAIHPDRVVDLTRDQARVSFDGAEATHVGDALAAFDAALPALLTIVAADMCGAAEWQLQTTNEYAQVRKQFERPIGFFQAVKHPIVNMMLDIDRARSLVYAAACAIDHEPDSALRLARMAKSAASDAAAYCSGRSVQLHGGIGFTWECDLHIYFKRQKHNQMYLGDGAFQRAALADSFD